MKMARRFWVLMMVVAVAQSVFMFLTVTGSGSGSDHDKFSDISEDSVTAMEVSGTQMKNNKDFMNLDDYHPIDPVPGSSATVTSGPIEHGAPLLPYIPKLTPPYLPGDAGSPSPPSPA